MENEPKASPEREADRADDTAKSSNDAKPDKAAARIERGEDNDPNPLAPPVNIEAGS